VQGGRKRDASLDAKILDATLEVLGDVGARGLTMDLVAAHAEAGKGAIYRRWPSKTALILDAIAHVKGRTLERVGLPDTGSLRGDLLAMFKPQSKKETAATMKMMAGLATLLTEEPALADAADSFFIDPFAEAHATLMQRAMARGEIPKHADIATLSRIVPTLAAYRALVKRQSFDREFLETVVDTVLIPALRTPPE
jgi:AcrR family transcriptional regulator